MSVPGIEAPRTTFYIRKVIGTSIWYIDYCIASLVHYRPTCPESFLVVVLIAFRALRTSPPTIQFPFELLVGGWSESGQLPVGTIGFVCILEGGARFSPRSVGRTVAHHEDNS